MAKNQTEKKKQKKEQDSVLYRLYGRTTLLLVLLEVILVILYISGNFQGFMDSTLNTLLSMSDMILMITVFFSAIGFIASIIMFFVTKRKRNWIFLLVYLIVFVVSAVFFVIFRILSMVSSGL